MRELAAGAGVAKARTNSARLHPIHVGDSNDMKLSVKIRPEMAAKRDTIVNRRG